jgi:2-polyprenyl-3-methyl-5-hydroxy-6-metoxy-1,4-benzoquinol methylase
MIDLAVRLRADELMDGDLPASTYSAVLQDLARVNTLVLARRPTLAFLGRVTPEGGSLRLLDVGFGCGDMLRSIGRWCRRRNVDAHLVGIDLNPQSAPIARAATPSDLPIDYRSGDYESLRDEPWDCVISSHVTHHMDETELVAFLRFMDRHASRGWFVNDLRRDAIAYFGFPVLAWVAGLHPIVRQDGRTSVARSFRTEDWSVLLREASVRPGARIFRSFPFRLCVEQIFQRGAAPDQMRTGASQSGDLLKVKTP